MEENKWARVEMAMHFRDLEDPTCYNPCQNLVGWEAWYLAYEGLGTSSKTIKEPT